MRARNRLNRPYDFAVGISQNRPFLDAKALGLRAWRRCSDSRPIRIETELDIAKQLEAVAEREGSLEERDALQYLAHDDARGRVKRPEQD